MSRGGEPAKAGLVSVARDWKSRDHSVFNAQTRRTLTRERQLAMRDQNLPTALSRDSRLRLAALIVATAILLGGACAAAPPARLAAQTAFLMPSFFLQLPLNPSTWGARPVQHAEIDLGDGSGAKLHVYSPSAGRHPALVISLGLEPAQPDDPRVVRLLEGFAHAGIVAALVESPALDNGRLDPSAPDLIVRAFQSVRAQPFTDANRIGFLGLSVGGSLVLLAASDPRISDQVRIVESFGAYGSLSSLIQATVTRSIGTGGHTEAWQPDALTIQAVRDNLIASLPSQSDQELLKGAVADGGQLSATAPVGLSPAGTSVYDILTSTGGPAVGRDLASLPSSQQTYLSALSPVDHLQSIKAPVYVMVDRGDPYVPFVESQAIDRTLVAGGKDVYFSEFDIFRHVEPTRGGNVIVVMRDLVRLFLHATAVIGRLEG